MVSAAPVWFTMLVQFVVAMVATISFGITFQVGRRHYRTCGFVGAVGWTIYIACTTLGSMTAPMATLIATLPLAALSRFFAIRHKAPITVFLLTGIIDIDSEHDYLLMEAIAQHLYAHYPEFAAVQENIRD